MSDYKEERKAREITRKITEEIGKFETKIKNVKELIIDIIEHDYDKLIFDLNVEKRLGIEKKKNRNETRETKNIQNNSWYK